MKKPLLLTLTAGFILFVVVGQQVGWFKSGNSESFPKFPETPSYSVTNYFNGEWAGRRINTTNNNLCERTTITGRIENGKATLRLTYNGTSLKGWVAEDTHILTLYANNKQWDYRFSGKVSADKVTGDWYLTNGPCRGHWYLERVTGKS
ncbi:hypothetical protein F2Z80_21650 [Vibrio fortis]|uniref:Uncharacterized protein n=1 Tax=Vibrio fortis TaxID=212667 RepID=A0A5N3S4D4_9VIBR|nr:hypothetical protein [Vibrio fortis]KAB0301650.1 hypothetical protein F2Z80_21650 [Vibrio fortis]